MKNRLFFLLFTISILQIAPASGFGFNFGHNVQLPSWVTTPPLDDAESIYGIGEGKTLDKAQNTALGNISGKMATVVSSSIATSTNVNQGKVASYFSENVRAKTLKTKLSGYEVIQSAHTADGYYVLVKMSRRIFVQDNLLRLKMLDVQLSNRVMTAAAVSRVQEYLALNEIHAKEIEATSLVILLQAASPSFDGSAYLSKYEGYRLRQNNLLFHLKLHVIADDNMTTVTTMLKKLFNDAHFSTNASACPCDATIAIHGNLKKSIVFSEYATQWRINIHVIDATGRILNDEDHVAEGSSLTSYDESFITTTNLLEKQFIDEGILSILGLKKSF